MEPLEEGSSSPPPPPPSPGLDEAVLAILGVDTALSKEKPALLQKDIAVSWTTILQRGLPEDERASLLTKYPIPENCSLLEAPRLNPEVQSVSREVVGRRDKKLVDLQNQIGTALSALGQLLTQLLGVDSNKNMALIQLASDASRILLDFHYKQSISRRELISLDLKKEAKQTLSNSHVDGWLFGDKLGERLKATKEVERSALDLKPTKAKVVKKPVVPSTSYAAGHLNFRGPPHHQGDYQGGRHQTTQIPRYTRQRFHTQEKRRGSNAGNKRREQSRPKFSREK